VHEGGKKGCSKKALFNGKEMNNNTTQAKQSSPVAGDGVLAVFQCRKCLTILGDSTSFFTADEQSKTITLRGNLTTIVMYCG
jgi:hypothetical protein